MLSLHVPQVTLDNKEVWIEQDFFGLCCAIKTFRVAEVQEELCEGKLKVLFFLLESSGRF